MPSPPTQRSSEFVAGPLKEIVGIESYRGMHSRYFLPTLAELRQTPEGVVPGNRMCVGAARTGRPVPDSRAGSQRITGSHLTSLRIMLTRSGKHAQLPDQLSAAGGVSAELGASSKSVVVRIRGRSCCSAIEPGMRVRGQGQRRGACDDRASPCRALDLCREFRAIDEHICGRIVGSRPGRKARQHTARARRSDCNASCS